MNWLGKTLTTDWRRRLLAYFSVLLLVVQAGCSAMSQRAHRADKSIAAREQGQLGWQYLQRGQLNEAAARLTHAIEDCPEDVRLRHDLAIVRREQSRSEEAIAEMQIAVNQSGGEPAWLVELARMQMDKGDLAEAWASADRALERQPSLASAWQVRGDVLTRTGRHAEALTDYHRAIAEGGESPELLMQVADAYRLMGRPRRALSTLQRLADTVPMENQPREMRLAQALAYQALDRHEEALTHFDQARKIQGDQPLLLTQLAISQWHTGDVDNARRTLLSASAAHPDDPRILAVLAEWEQAQDAARNVIASR